MFVNEVDNNLANVAVEVALNYVKKNPQLGLSVDMMYVEGNRTDSKDLLQARKNYEYFCRCCYLYGVTA